MRVYLSNGKPLIVCFCDGTNDKIQENEKKANEEKKTIREVKNK